MPKMKTRSAVKKRFKLTAKGHLKHGAAYKRHILTKKNKKRKRHLGGTSLVHPTQEKQLKMMLQG